MYIFLLLFYIYYNFYIALRDRFFLSLPDFLVPLLLKSLSGKKLSDLSLLFLERSRTNIQTEIYLCFFITIMYLL